MGTNFRITNNDLLHVRIRTSVQVNWTHQVYWNYYRSRQWNIWQHFISSRHKSLVLYSRLSQRTLRRCTRIQTRRLSAVFTVVYTERTHAVVCRSVSQSSNFTRVYFVARWRHCLIDCIDTDGKSGMETSLLRRLHQSADSVAVSDDSMSVEATSLSSVTVKDIRVAQSRHPAISILDHLTLMLIDGKAVAYLSIQLWSVCR